jgi:hypothetical protein
MRISRDELRKFDHAVGPAPPRVEPLMSAAEEARVIRDATLDDPVTEARRERVRALLRRPAPSEGADAELIVLLAAARALPLRRPEDRVNARVRLAEIGRLEHPPPEVEKLVATLGLDPGDSQAFADALLPSKHDVSPFTQDSYTGPSHIP